MSENFLPSFPKTFRKPRKEISRDEFRARIAGAMRRRLFPNTGLRKVDLAHALQLTSATVDNWLAGYSQPDSYVLTKMISLFDAGFANEVFGTDVVVAKLDDMRRFISLKEVNRTAPALAAIEELVNTREVA